MTDYESISKALPFHFPENPLESVKLVGLPLSVWLAQLMTFTYLAPAGALQMIDGAGLPGQLVAAVTEAQCPALCPSTCPGSQEKDSS